MDQDRKNTTGAPSSDTTSALFVSARKKQLEQQEADQRAKEKEEQRLAAEAEVRRLEAEVAERRRKAEEDAKRADEEAVRIAEEARLKKAQAAEDPDAVLGAPPQKKEIKLPQLPPLPKFEKKEAGSGNPFFANLLKNKKLLGIIGGGVAVAILAVVLIVTLGGRGAQGGGTLTVDANAALDAAATVDDLAMVVQYPEAIFPDQELTGDYFALFSADGNAAIEYMKGSAYAPENLTEEAMNAHLDEMLAAISAAMAEETMVVDSGMVYDEAELYVYFDLSYTTGEGEDRYLSYVGLPWTNVSTGESNFIDTMLDCPVSLYDAYYPLSERIRASMADA